MVAQVVIVVFAILFFIPVAIALALFLLFSHNSEYHRQKLLANTVARAIILESKLCLANYILTVVSNNFRRGNDAGEITCGSNAIDNATVGDLGDKKSKLGRKFNATIAKLPGLDMSKKRLLAKGSIYIYCENISIIWQNCFHQKIAIYVVFMTYLVKFHLRYM